MSCTQPATATQPNRAAEYEGYCLVADWLNSARLLNWLRDLQICTMDLVVRVMSKYRLALFAQTVNSKSNLIAGLEINRRPLANTIPGGVPVEMMSPG
jgi:hypothetical protein